MKSSNSLIEALTSAELANNTNGARSTRAVVKSSKVSPAASNSFDSSRILMPQPMLPMPRNSTIFNASGCLYPLYVWMNTRCWTIFITFVTLYALFADDIRILLFPKSLDIMFGVFALLAFLVFTVEIIVYSYCKPSYRFRFYFWLDVIATIAMIPDITFFWTYLLESVFGSTTVNGVIDTARVSRLGARSSRIIKVIRLIRLIRIVKLYKIVQRDEVELDDDINLTQNPSIIGKKLSEKTMKRVIVLVLATIVVMPLLSIELWQSTMVYGEVGLGLLNLRYAPTLTNATFMNDTSTVAYSQWYSHFQEDVLFYLRHGSEYGDVVYLYLDGDKQDLVYDIAMEANITYLQKNQSVIIDEYRIDEYQVATAGYSISDISLVWKRKLQALLGIMQTLAIMLILAYGYVGFSSDAYLLVIRPIQRMVECVRMLAENPIGASFENNIVLEGEADETVLLQRTIAKIAKLLQIGFGEAGAEIIAKNIASNSGIEPMTDGVKVQAVFGFCDIRNFTDTTECLQGKVMIYVNRVAQIVHEATHMYYGAANKNIGDAFLLIWKVSSSSASTKDYSSVNMCENALVAFLKTQVDLKRENGKGGCLHEYRLHPAIRKRFGDGFEIRLGMGLHVGWAIEGTIGSKYKIDASYLSPNVNIAARLEAATKQFGSPLLMSEQFYLGLSPFVRRKCRKIDHVSFKGSAQSIGLYTFDIATYPMTFAEPRYDARGERVAFSFKSQEIDALMEGIPDSFTQVFATAVGAYLAGEWTSAVNLLNEALLLMPNDGPSLALLDVIQNLHHGEPPRDWEGFRVLTEK